MKWFRRHIKTGSRLALFALALQFVLSFGHFHFNAAQADPAIQAQTDLTQATGGDARRVIDGGSLDMPRIVPVRASSVYRGDGWMGVKMRDASVVKGVGVLPMFAGIIGLLLLLGAFAATWLREGR